MLTTIITSIITGLVGWFGRGIYGDQTQKNTYNEPTQPNQTPEPNETAEPEPTPPDSDYNGQSSESDTDTDYTPDWDYTTPSTTPDLMEQAKEKLNGYADYAKDKVGYIDKDD